MTTENKIPNCPGEDCDVIPRDMLDAEFAKNFEKPWIVEGPGRQLQFDTEDEACAFQRDWRTKNGLDPMTGQPARQAA